MAIFFVSFLSIAGVSSTFTWMLIVKYFPLWYFILWGNLGFGIKKRNCVWLIRSFILIFEVYFFGLLLYLFWYSVEDNEFGLFIDLNKLFTNFLISFLKRKWLFFHKISFILFLIDAFLFQLESRRYYWFWLSDC